MYPSNRFPTNYLSLQGLQVLDNVDCCDLMTWLLQPYGIEVQTAFSVKLALKIFGLWQPDVLVSDIALPEEDGYHLIEQLRTNAGEQGKMVPTIAVTGYVDETTRQRTLLAGFDFWFTKPLDFDEFLAVLACLAICQQSTYANAQRILGNVSGHGDLNLEKYLKSAFSFLA